MGINNVLGRNLRKLRAKQNLTQAEMAEKVGLSPRYYVDLEHGRKWPSPQTLEKLSTGLGVPVWTLFDGEPNTFPSQDIYRAVNSMSYIIKSLLEENKSLGAKIENLRKVSSPPPEPQKKRSKR